LLEAGIGRGRDRHKGAQGYECRHRGISESVTSLWLR
jgi:hypothetical protein